MAYYNYSVNVIKLAWPRNGHIKREFEFCKLETILKMMGYGLRQGFSNFYFWRPQKLFIKSRDPQKISRQSICKIELRKNTELGLFYQTPSLRTAGLR